MGGKFGWFLLGLVSGVTLMTVLQRSKEHEKQEDFESIADELTKRFAKLEKSASS